MVFPLKPESEYGFVELTIVVPEPCMKPVVPHSSAQLVAVPLSVQPRSADVAVMFDSVCLNVSLSFVCVFLYFHVLPFQCDVLYFFFELFYIDNNKIMDVSEYY